MILRVSSIEPGERRTTEMSCDDETLAEGVLRFSNVAYDLLDDYLQAIGYLYDRGKEVASLRPQPLDLRDLDEWVREFLDPVDRRIEERHGYAVNPREPGFIEAVRLLQNEVLSRIEAQRRRDELEWPALPHLSRLLRGEISSLLRAFGTPSNAWDLLVEVRYNLFQAQRRTRELEAWIVALVTEGERFFRDFLVAILTHLGSSLFADFVASLVEQPLPGLHLNGTASGVVTVPKEREWDESISTYMSEGSNQTTVVALRFSTNAHFDFYPRSPGFEPGFMNVLRWLGAESEEVWTTMVVTRRAILHKTPPAEGSPLDSFHTRNETDLATLADFVGALGLQFALNAFHEAVSRYANRTGHSEAVWRSGLMWRLPGSLRTIVKRLLQDGRWPFAWVLAEIARAVEPPGPVSKMPALNALFARQQMGREFGFPGQFVTIREIEAFDVEGEDPRYVLFKRSMLKSFEGIEDVLTAALNKDLALDEIETWPGFRNLRQSVEYRRWRAGLALDAPDD